MDRRGYEIRTLAGPISETFYKKTTKQEIDWIGHERFQAYVINTLMLPSLKHFQRSTKDEREEFHTENRFTKLKLNS